jgi:hypothetical protein
MSTIWSFCDHSGHWASPWADAFHRVILVDPQHPRGWGNKVTKNGAPMLTFGGTVREFLDEGGVYAGQWRPTGILAAPPCTDFSVSGAQYWPAKDSDGRTAAAVRIVRDVLEAVNTYSPDWWMLENPVGRLPRLVPELGKPRIYVQPHHYAHLADDPDSERYTKKTGLWGEFDVERLEALRGSLEPVRSCAQGSWIQRLGGKSARTKRLRSVTPVGLARACYLTTTADLVRNNTEVGFYRATV